MKRTLCLFLSVVMALSILTTVPFIDSPFKITVSAVSSGTCGKNVKWSLGDSGVLKITGSGEMEYYAYDWDVPWTEKYESIKSVVIEGGVTSIGNYAFLGCKNLTSVTIPSSVKHIGMLAFDGCEKLKSIKLPSGLTTIEESTFRDCTSLKSVTIPSNVKSIGYSAFYCCEKLETINLPDSLVEVNDQAFKFTAYYNNKDNWTKNNVLYIGKYLITGVRKSFENWETEGAASGGCIVKSGTKLIADAAFVECNELKSLSLPESLSYIGNDAFGYTEKLAKITVNSENKYFSSLNGVLFNKSKTRLILYPLNKASTSYTVPTTVKTIDDNSFYGSKNLVSLTVKDGVTTIGASAFSNCAKLKTIKLPDTLYKIGSYAFDSTAYYNNSKNWSDKVLYIGKHLVAVEMGIKGSYTVESGTKSIASGAFRFTDITSVTLPSSLRGIGEEAFRYCIIESIKIPSNVKYIGKYAFAGSKLKKAELPSKLKTIESETFSNSSISSVRIPDSVTKIDELAFVDCENLKTVTIPKSVKTIGEKAFGYCWDSENGSGYIKNKKGLTIRALPDTTAEQYAKENGFTFKKITKPGTVELGKATTTSNGVKITWSKVTGADSYTVYRKTGDGSYKAIKTVTGTSYTDTSAKSGTKYRYNVRAENEAGYGKYCEIGVNKLYLATPKVTVSNASSGVTVKWNKITGAKGYYIYRKASGADSWTKIATIKSGSTVSYTDKKASVGKKYYYTVKAYNGDYVSATKASSIIERLKAPTLKTVTSGESGVTVKWAKTTGADGYYVYRKTGSGSYTKIATVKGNTSVTYLDKSAKKSNTYTYYVKAYSGKSVSSRSKTLKIKDKY